MHLLFVDESGTPPKPGDDRTRYFVVGAVIIPENSWHSLRDALFAMKERRKIRGEFKWRYFVSTNSDAKNPMRHLDATQRDAIREEIYRTVAAEKEVRSMAAVCSVAAAYSMPSISGQEDIYHLTYKTLTERFQYHLQDLSNESGQTVCAALSLPIIAVAVMTSGCAIITKSCSTQVAATFRRTRTSPRVSSCKSRR
jgi:hypothetical protein